MKYVRSKKWHFIGLVLFQSLIIILAGYFYYSNEISEARKEKERDLQAIGGFKINQFSQWVAERKADALVNSGSPLIEEKVNEYLETRSDKIRGELMALLDMIREDYHYENVMITSPEGEIYLSAVREQKRLEELSKEFIRSTIKQKNLVFTDFYYCETESEIHYDVMAPIHSEAGGIAAILVLRVDPLDFIYPLIQLWPVPSKTAETLLIKKEGDKIVFLNELRHKKNTALKFTLPLSTQSLPAAMVIKGYAGIFHGIDYRGHEVISFVSPVKGTQWYLVAKMDKKEVYENLYSRAVFIAVIVILIILLSGAGLAFIYSNRQRKIYRELWRNQEEYKTTLQSIGDAVITTDTEGKVKYLNAVAENLTGWILQDAVSKPLDEVFKIINEYTHKNVENPVEKVLRENIVVGLANHTLLISKEGKEIPIADSGAPIKDDKGVIHGVVLVFRDQIEERKQEKELEENRRRLLTLMSNLPGMAYRCENTPDWKMNFVSEGCYNLTGYRAEELIKNNIVSYNDLIYPEDRERVWRTVQEGIKENGHYMITYRLICREGKTKWVWERGQRVPNDDPDIEKLEGFITDISDQKETEIRLTESEKKYKYLFENNPMPMWVYDLDTLEFLVVNDAAIEHYGYSQKEFLSMTIKDIRPADDIQKLYDNVKSSPEGINYSGIWRHKRRDGAIIFAEIISHEIEYENRKARIVLANDVTKRRAAERKFRMIWDSAGDGMRLTDKDGNITGVNNAFTRLIGLSREELEGKPLSVIYRNESDRIIKKHRERFRERTILPRMESRFTLHNGEKKWFEVTNTYINIEGEPEQVLAVFRDVTERKMFEEALRESEEKFRSIFNESPIGIFYYNKEKIVTECNKKFVEIMGGTRDRLINMNMPNELKDKKLLEAIDRSLTEGEAYYEDLYTSVSGGKQVYVRSIFKKVDFGNGGRVAGIGLVEDVTERKKAEKQINFQSKLVNSVGEAVITTDVEGKIVYWNRSAEKIYGWKSEEVIGKRVLDIIPAGENKQQAEEIFKELQQGKTWQGEFMVKKKSGEIIPVLVTDSAIRDDAGNITGIIGVSNDISEIHKKRKELKESEQKLKEAQRLAGMGSFEYFFESEKIEISEELARILEVDISEKKLEFAKLDGLSVEGNEQKIKNNINFIKETGQNVDFDIEILSGKGEKKYLHITGKPNRDERGNITGVTGTAIDVSRRKTTELELVEAKEKAEEMNKIKSFFFANMSHELRTPMWGIMGYADLLLENLEGSEDEELARGILTSANRLTATLTNILDITKLEFDKTEIIYDNRNIVAIIDDVIKDYSITASKKSIELIKSVEFDELYMKTDEKLMRGILNNLVSNSIKYTERGSVTVSAEIMENNGNKQLKIDVIDTGIGIPEEKQDIIFEPFRQASEGTNRAFQGTGLGLAIIKRYTELLKGTISVSSTEGEGSVFTVFFPLK